MSLQDLDVLLTSAFKTLADMRVQDLLAENNRLKESQIDYTDVWDVKGYDLIEIIELFGFPIHQIQKRPARFESLALPLLENDQEIDNAIGIGYIGTTGATGMTDPSANVISKTWRILFRKENDATEFLKFILKKKLCCTLHLQYTRVSRLANKQSVQVKVDSEFFPWEHICLD